MHFFTDKPFNCGKYTEFKNARLYSIVGADLAEKGKIIQIISEIFSECRQELYFSPFERRIPCALYLPELNSLVACNYNESMHSGTMTRYYDSSRVMSGSFSAIEEIFSYTMAQSRMYMEKSLDLIGITDLLFKEYVRNGTELLERDKLKNYAYRKISSMLDRKKGGAAVYSKAVSAVTCGGYRFAEFPEDYTIIRLCDDYIAASRCFVKTASDTANKLGYETIVCHAVDSENAPLHLVIPEAKTAFLSDSQVLPIKQFEESRRVGLVRFYESQIMESREHYITFSGGYIKKMLSEAILYSRICMDIKNQGRKLMIPYISEKKSADISSEIVSNILNS